MKYTITVFSIIILFSLSCKKEKIDDIFERYLFDLNSNCTDTEIPELEGFTTGYQFIIDSNNVNYPFFNPNNPNEILFYNQYSTKNIYIYNRANSSKKVLINANLLSPPKWGKNGWILLTNGIISKIRENGDSLQTVTTGLYPEWNYNASRFAYDTYNPNTGKNIGVIYNFQSNLKDTLPFMLNADKCWQNQSNRIVYFRNHDNQSHFFVADMNSVSTNPFMEITSPGPPCWINDNEFVYQSNQKIYIYNLQTASNKTIAKLCSKEFIGYMSYAPSTKELITNLDHWKSIGDNKIVVSSKLIIFNFNDNSVSYITP